MFLVKQFFKKVISFCLEFLSNKLTNTKQTDRTQARIVKVRPFWDHRKDHTKLASSDTLHIRAERDDPLMNDIPLINAKKETFSCERGTFH